jgi:tetratricopeptide (TPR) repeat protein
VWEFESGYAQLARYVTPGAILQDSSLKAQLTLDEVELPSAVRDQIRAERLYEQLRGRAIGFDAYPWASQEGVQQIRHPWWLVSEQYGNCLDLSLAYAGMCLAANVGALLALDEHHAYVVLTPGRLYEPPAKECVFELEGFDEEDPSRPGVIEGSETALRDAIAEGKVTAVDLVEVTRGSDFEFATEAMQARWESRPAQEVHLVDVAHLQLDKAYAELPHPTSFRPSVRLRVPGGGTGFRKFGAHAKVIAGLQASDGMHVLIGERGRGKSTIARHLAESAKDGAAWFLDASDRKALSNSLAQAMFGELPRSEQQQLDPPERKAMWETAYAYLRAKEGPWLIVLDNADGDPATLRGLVPEPRPGQRLLVTTTNPSWRLAPGYTPHDLPEVESGDFGRFSEGPVAGLIEGRPLLLEAFERLAGNSGWDGSEVPAPPAGIAGELRGPAVFWSLLQGDDEFGDRERKVAALAAYLPANGQPVSALEELVPGSAPAIKRLIGCGLLASDANAGEVRMHRLFGEAIRTDLEAIRPELCDEVVLALALNEATRVALDEKGDPETVLRLDRRLAGVDPNRDPDYEFGLALHGVAELLELHGNTRASGKTYERAERHLDGHPLLLADCLQGRARTVNQHHSGERVMLEQALDWARTAHRMLLEEGEARGADRDVVAAKAARCYAMQGLLMKKFPIEGKSRLEQLHEALTVLEEADEQRRDSEEISDEEKARSRFNLAGARIQLAQQEPERAEEHLREAHKVYKEVGDTRRRLYGRMNHPHIAACENGLGLVGYYRALLIPASRRQQTDWLRQATAHTTQALFEREILDGDVDFEEAPKSAALLAKIALARNASPVASLGDSEALAAKAMEELSDAGRVLKPVSLPPIAADLEEAIDAWVRSDALSQLVEQFDGEPPSGELAALLEWLDSFSAENWDFRKGERDDVAPPQLSLLTEKVVKAAAKSLGLVEGGSMRKVPYEQAVILGGMARGCLSRPRQAAKLIAAGKLDAAAVTALGGFRPLGEKEVELVEKVEGVTLANEFEAMDAGVRHAFGLGEPDRRDGEDSEAEGASWRVHEYTTASGLPVRVAAAPSSEPCERRANTPDTFAWLATELAKLKPGQRVLVVTTDIYVPFQHADALRMLALPYGVEVDTIGVVPGKVDRRLAHSFEPHNYLQEVRSAIRSLRMLHAALAG